MAARIAPAALLIALLLTSCASESARVPAGCLGDPATIEQALERAPAAVTLAGGARLSTCVSRARSDADLQTLGTSLMKIADSLSARATADRGAALRLGYLTGAARRGVAASPGLAANLGRRLEQTMLLPRRSAAARAALQRGLRAGEEGG